MTVSLCIDNRFGLTFHNRRLSRDRAVTEDIIRHLSGKLYLNEMSRAVFSEFGEAVVCEDFLEKAGENDLCFVENRDIAPYKDKITRMILYHWNRDYPSDFRLDPAVLEGFSLKETTEFKGTSHEKITKEVYEK